MAEDVTVRPAADWDDVRRAAIGAGRTFSGRSPEEPFFFERTVSAPTLPLENTLLLRVDGTIASQLQVYERQAVFGGARVWFGAIGNVYTLPEYQGEGYVTRLLEYAGEFIEDKSYAYSVLLTGASLEPLYRQGGWERLPQVLHRVSDPDPISSATADDVERFTATEDLETLARIYSECRGSVDGGVVRPRSYWRNWILDPAMEVIDDDAVVFYRPRDDVEGYMIWEGRDDGVACLETGYDGEQSEAFVSACWNFLAARAGDRITWYPQPVTSLSDTIAPDLRREPVRGRMVQVHDADTLSRLAAAPIRSTDDLVDSLSDFYWSPVDSF